jgi:hypothetical protein
MDGFQTVKAKNRGLIMLKVCFSDSALLFSFPNLPFFHLQSDPARDFITAIDKWYPTWPTTVEDRAVIV